MQTISTKYVGPSYTKGSRIIARASAAPGSVIVDIDHSLSIEDNHANAARKLMEKLNWKGKMCGGHTVTGMVWVFMEGFMNIIHRE